MLIKYDSLKQKDLDYMKFVLRHGMVTAKQVFLNFQEKNMDTVYRRLRKLRDKGYLKHDTKTIKTGIYMGTEGARNITELPVTIAESPTVYTLKHSLLMVDLIVYYQLYFKNKGNDFSYTTEREIRYEALKDVQPGKAKIEKLNKIKERFPDCAFYIKDRKGNEHKIWVELELNQKESKRYDEKFKQRFEPALANGEYTNVWYFSDAQRILVAVEKAKSKIMNGNKIKASGIPDVIKKDTWEEVLTHGNGKGTSTGKGEE